jgi:hypothetical protein
MDTLLSIVVIVALVVIAARVILKFFPSSPEGAFVQKVVAFLKALALHVEADEQKIATAVKAEVAKLGGKKP